MFEVELEATDPGDPDFLRFLWERSIGIKELPTMFGMPMTSIKLTGARWALEEAISTWWDTGVKEETAALLSYIELAEATCTS